MQFENNSWSQSLHRGYAVRGNQAKLLPILALSLFSASAGGAGFSLTEFSIKGMGSAYAGTTAGADEAATIYWNPAGMTRLEGNQVQAGVAYVNFSAQFTNEGSTQTLLAVPGTPPAFVTLPSAGGNDDAGGTFLVPNAYLSLPVNNSLTFGLGVNVPFGLETEYAPDWVGRYHAIKSSLKSVNINPSLAYRVDDRWSVGAGISAQYVDATLSRAVFTGGADGLVKLEGNDWTAGFNVGILFEPSDSTRFGLSYRSATDHDIDGTRTLSALGYPFDGKDSAKVSLHLPPNLAFGFRHHLAHGISLMGDVTWTGWSSFDELRVSFDDGSPDDVTVSDWNDSWRFALGVDYILSSSWTLRSGLMYDQSPIPGPEYRTPRIPDSDRTWIAVGATWNPSRNLFMDLGYGYLFMEDAPLRNTIDLAPALAPGAFTDTLVGEYNSSSYTFAAEVRYQF